MPNIAPVARSKLASPWGCSLLFVCLNWVAVKELKLSYYIGETFLFTRYTQYSNLI